ncbi:hypothetical protein HYX16_05135 [Candidatus Woesearchaeota archaeon]|nr:hypothetical protein [Candidatus Woesearchaeota archaeon]
MSLELLIGVLHNKSYLDLTKEIIDRNYPEGPESLMLELPFSLPTAPFFGNLETTYKEKGTRIIYGDKYRIHIPRNKDFLRSLDWINFLIFAMVDAVLVSIDYPFIRKRDKKMLEVIEKEKPQVAVVGGLHANYIKKIMPHVKYIAQWIPADGISEKVFTALFGPYKPDEIVLV